MLWCMNIGHNPHSKWSLKHVDFSKKINNLDNNFALRGGKNDK